MLSGRRPLWALASILALAALVRLATVAGESDGRASVHDVTPGGGHSTARPNLLVITTDDQTLAQFSPEAMPHTWRFFHRAGSVFTNSLAVPPLCCPDRAGFLTGEYAHNHGVLTNVSGYSHLRQKQNTLPVWLSRAGYRTALVGKYLNDYPALGPTTAPGWDEFFAAGGLTIGYRDFDVGVNGKPRHFGPRRYSTSLYTHRAERFMGRTAEHGRPFFLWLTYNAPHTVPDGRSPCRGERAQPETTADYRRFARAPLPSTPALGEHSVADKGRWIRSEPPVFRHRRAWIERDWRCTLAALPPVDRGFQSIVQRLRNLGQLDRTVIVFTSDNGQFFGEHRIPSDKKLPYDPALRVPLAISVPAGIGGGTSPAKLDGLVSNVDLAPTLLDYARAEPCKRAGRCRTLDGHSLRRLLSGRTPAWMQSRAIPIELDEDFTYKAFRTRNLLYMELAADRLGRLPDPQIELYDLRRDPFELHNLWATHRSAERVRQRRLAGRLRELTQCSGTQGARACP